jgi:hypothetical protein
MAGSPRFKIHNPSGEYIASCKHLEDAAAIVGNYGDGATIKDGGRVVWREGREAFSAAESYDGVRETVWERVRAYNQKALAKLRARGIEL